jgi:hypothetical protein
MGSFAEFMESLEIFPDPTFIDFNILHVMHDYILENNYDIKLIEEFLIKVINPFNNLFTFLHQKNKVSNLSVEEKQQLQVLQNTMSNIEVVEEQIRKFSWGTSKTIKVMALNKIHTAFNKFIIDLRRFIAIPIATTMINYLEKSNIIDKIQDYKINIK